MVVPEEFVTMAQTYRVLSGLDPQQLRKLLPIAQDRNASFCPGLEELNQALLQIG